MKKLSHYFESQRKENASPRPKAAVNESTQLETPANESTQLETPANESKQIETPADESKQLETPADESKQLETPSDDIDEQRVEPEEKAAAKKRPLRLSASAPPKRRLVIDSDSDSDTVESSGSAFSDAASGGDESVSQCDEKSSLAMKSDSTHELSLSSPLLTKSIPLGMQTAEGVSVEDVSRWNKDSAEIVHKVSVESVILESCDQEGDSVISRVDDLLRRSVAAGEGKLFTEYLYSMTDYYGVREFPTWMDPRVIKDADGEVPESSSFDPSRIFVPKNSNCVQDKAHQTPAMKQYWSLKKDLFSTILFFKVGKFYEIFYHDAVLAHKLFALKFMNHDPKPHVGFPETALMTFGKKFVAKGYKVAVVEQTETPHELARRNSENLGAPKQKAVNREVCEMMSVATTVSGDSMIAYVGFITNTAERLVAVFLDPSCSCWSFHSSMMDVALNELQQWRARYHTVQAYVDLITSETYPGLISALGRCDVDIRVFPKTGGEGLIELSSTASQVVADAIHRCCHMVYVYLENMLISEGFIRSCGTIVNGDVPENSAAASFQIPAHVSLQLDLVTIGKKDEPSVFAVLNNTSTAMGARRLREMLQEPLTCIVAIRERQEAVTFMLDSILPFISDPGTASSPLKKCVTLEGFRDYDRVISNFCKQTAKRRAVYFDKHPIHQFNALRDTAEKLCSTVLLLGNFLLDKELGEDELPKLIRRSLIDERPIRVVRVFEHILERLEWKALECAGSQVGLNLQKGWLPSRGSSVEFDAAQAKLEVIKLALNDELQALKKRLGVPSLSYVHTKYKYEVDIPLLSAKGPLWKQMSVDIRVTSRTKTNLRFQNQTIRDKVAEMDVVNMEVSDSLLPAFHHMVAPIVEVKTELQKYLKAVGTYDALLSFAKYCTNIKGTSNSEICAVRFDKDGPLIAAKTLHHPLVSYILHGKGKTFAPYNIEIGQSCKIIVLTGSNMAGKSTVLRAIGMAVIFAQVFGFACAGELSLRRPFVEIFTRFGAQDSILQGRSTFLVELEEVAPVLNSVSGDCCLSLIDELGRGTSTFDGTAIALSFLKHVAISGSVCLFSTHYHVIADKVSDGELLLARNMHMESKLLTTGHVQFTFKLAENACRDSQGILIARRAGLPETLLSLARGKSLEMKTRLDATD